MKKLLVAVLVLCLALSMVPAFALELLSGADTYPIDTDKTITWYAQGNRMKSLRTGRNLPSTPV